MPGVLISGPAGAGKTLAARNEVEAAATPAVAIDFQSLYASLLLLEREGRRYPEREARHGYAIPLTEYVRRAAITGALQRDLTPILTNSDGDPVRRAELLALLGPGARELVIDPGRDAVVDRLSVDGQLSDQCKEAVNRWYGRRTL